MDAALAQHKGHQGHRGEAPTDFSFVSFASSVLNRSGLAMFREIVHSQPDTSDLPPSFAYVLRPYVDLLLKKTNDPAATESITNVA